MHHRHRYRRNYWLLAWTTPLATSYRTFFCREENNKAVQLQAPPRAVRHWLCPRRPGLSCCSVVGAAARRRRRTMTHRRRRPP
jgi:hypothetical protein